MVGLYDYLSCIRIHDILGDVSAGETLLQALDGLLAVGKGLDLHVGDLSLSFTAVCLTDDQILGYVYQTSGQITRVGGTQSRIGQTLTGSMGRDEVLQYVQTFTEVGLNGKLDGVTGSIGHKASHSSQLLDLLIRTSGSGVSHHEDVVVLIQASQQIVGQLIVRLLPGIDHLFITLLLGDKTAAEVLGDPVHSGLCIR